MSSTNDRTIFNKQLLFVLPAINTVVFILTEIAGEKSASAGNPFVSVDLPVSLPLVARDDWPTVVAVGLFGIAWWYFIAQIGYSSRRSRISRTVSALGALLIFFFCLADGGIMFSELSCCILREPNFSIMDLAIYATAVVLLAGGLVSAGCAAMNALKSQKS